VDKELRGLGKQQLITTQSVGEKNILKNSVYLTIEKRDVHRWRMNRRVAYVMLGLLGDEETTTGDAYYVNRLNDNRLTFKD
jgi:hypothetical protein